MNIQTETAILPIYWASYLIYGDASGLEDSEQAEIDAWLPEGWNCTDVGEAYFAPRNDATDLGGDVAEYTFIVYPK